MVRQSSLCAGILSLLAFFAPVSAKIGIIADKIYYPELRQSIKRIAQDIENVCGDNIDNWARELRRGYEHAILGEHGNPVAEAFQSSTLSGIHRYYGGNCFSVKTWTSDDYMEIAKMPQTGGAPQALFYTLVSCSNLNFLERNTIWKSLCAHA
jgi:hypothetical protein